MGLLRAAWNAPPAMPRPPRRVWRDWVLLGLAVVGAVIEGILRTDLDQPVLGVAALLAALPTVLWRRTRPLLMLAIVFVLTTPVQLIRPDAVLYTSVVLVVVAYSLFRWGSGRELLIGAPLLLIGLSLSFVRDGSVQDLVGGLAVLLAVAMLGMTFRMRAASRQRRLDRIRMLEREQLARDLHDTVAHHVSAIAIRAQAGLALSAQDPAAARDALGVINDEAARTLSELRSMVRVLRHDDSADLAPSPRLSDAEQLAGARPGGAVVTVRVVGDDDGIPSPVAAAVFRLAQESVTNALRHARRLSSVEVVIEVDADGVRLRVADDGDSVAASVPGFGITGMMERAALLGGTCQAGPAPDSGWLVTATLPRAGWAS